MGCCWDKPPSGALSPFKDVNKWARKHGLVFKKDIQGEYILGQKLGEGASGVVYRAEPRQGGGTVAVKMLRKGTAVRSRAQYMELVSEIVALRRLDHPHIVRMVDVFNNQNAVHIVQEFMAGGELRNHILDVGRYTEAVARGFISTLVDAVAHCHERNIIHRDIKAENVLLTSGTSPSIKLADFGLCDHNYEHGTTVVEAKGTASYMPPELLDGESTLHGKEADCWSLGVLFYWLLCGCDPFPLGLERRTVRRLEKKTYQWPGRGYQELSADAQKFLQSILRPKPTERLTCDAMIRHPWMLAANASDQVLVSALVDLRRKMGRTMRVVRAAARMKRLSQATLTQCHSAGTVAALVTSAETKFNVDDEGDVVSPVHVYGAVDLEDGDGDAHRAATNAGDASTPLLC